MKALLSLYDKTGAAELARALHDHGMDLVSTGTTHRVLTEAGLPVQQVADLTGFPEMLDGRVKTLHPVVHAGILARRDLPEHAAQLALRGLETIDLVAVNLYPFEATITKPGVTFQEALENIDIGGPTLLRAAAKNHPFVVVLSDPADYAWVAERLEAAGCRLRSAAHWRPRPSSTSPSTTPSSPASSAATKISAKSSPWASARPRTSATARTRTSAPPFTPRRPPAEAW